MKRKLIYVMTAVALSATAFFIGQETGQKQCEQAKTNLDLNNEQDWDAACDFMAQIVDWNTDGKELSVITKDGYELYGVKSQDIYDLSYIPIK